jgi:spore maturation protein CgeB
VAKIFLSFFNGIQDCERNNKIPCYYESFINGLKNFGNDVFVYYDNAWHREFREIPEELLEEIKVINPDTIILFNNYFYDISEYFECPIIIFEVDSPIYFWNKDKIVSNPNRYKFFVCQTESLEYISNVFGVSKKNIVKVPFFSEIKAKNIPQVHNISFIGTFFHYGNFVNEFMLNNPAKNDINQMQEVFEYISKNPFITEQDIVDKLNITSIKINKCLDTERIIGFLSSKNRIKVLSAVADLGLKLYGTKTWLTEFNFYPEIAFSYDTKQIFSIKDQEEVYNASKLSISISHIQAQSGFPWRVCDIMATNSCLVSDYHLNFESSFPGIKVPTFNNPYEARKVCKKLLQEDNMRRDIVLSCQEIINKKFRFENILDIIESFLGIKLRTEKVGTVEILKEQNFLQTLQTLQTLQKDNSGVGYKIVNSIEKLEMKNRIKMFGYLFCLMLGQIPIVDLLINTKIRERLSGKIRKYYR